MKYFRCYINLLFAVLILQLFSSCEKEYSYEGGNLPTVVMPPIDTTHITDTVINDPWALPNCTACRDIIDIAPSTWGFKTNHSILCGQVDTAFVLNLERSTFTFFGPSLCGADTGLVFTVSMGERLDKDLHNIAAVNASFYYYHTNYPYVLLSHPDQRFSFTITDYTHATRTATGTFSGIGFRVDGSTVIVTQGKFKCTLH